MLLCSTRAYSSIKCRSLSLVSVAFLLSYFDRDLKAYMGAEQRMHGVCGGQIHFYVELCYASYTDILSYNLLQQ